MSATRKQFYQAIERTYRLLGNWYRVAAFHNRSESTIMRWHRGEKAPSNEYVLESHIKRTEKLKKYKKRYPEGLEKKTEDGLKALFH